LPPTRGLTASQTILITGGTSGIGLATAERLAVAGAHLVLISHNPLHGNAAQNYLQRRTPHADITIHRADLSSLDEIKRLAEVLNRTLAKIDVLINNAGAIFTRRELTADGLERTFALNHMSYFVLTNLLRERLLQSAPSRIINVASEMHRLAKLDFSDLQNSIHFTSWKAYSRSKLCNVLFAAELARRLRGTGVTANSFHPGLVASRFGDDRGFSGLGFRILKILFGISPRSAAAALANLATSPDLGKRTGEYFWGHFSVWPSRTARDASLARRLWDESVMLSGLKSTF